jgi:hypothetical protein
MISGGEGSSDAPGAAFDVLLDDVELVHQVDPSGSSARRERFALWVPTPTIARQNARLHRRPVLGGVAGSL